MALAGKIEFEAKVGKDIAWDDRVLYRVYGAPKPDGVSEKTLEITLPRNALVQQYEVVLGAATAHAVAAGDAGQVRSSPNPAGGDTVVIDFGTPRTVSAVQAPGGALITSVSTWIGTEFVSKFSSDGAGSNYLVLRSEVRTERLQLVVTGGPSIEELATNTVLVLPESPAGIELRIDGGTPVFSQPAAVDPGASAELSRLSWNSASERVVDLGPALAALTGDPLDESMVTFKVVLTSAVPGIISLEPRAGGQRVLRIRRATFNSQPATDVAFESEGQKELVLESLPPNLTVQEVRLTASGAPPGVRVAPPVGPEAASPVFADLTLTPDRAACIRVPWDARFQELAGVRFPLATGDSGAEARVLLWRSKDLVDLSPSEALANAASEPVTIAAGAEEWRTFSWKKAVPAPKEYVLWAALIVSRGEAVMTFAEAAQPEVVGAERLLWGAPTGPWHDLPQALVSARGRIRAIGKAKPDAPYPPLRLQLGAGTALADVTPNAKGTPAELSSAPEAAQSGLTRLVLTSHAPANVTLKDIDVISTT